MTDGYELTVHGLLRKRAELAAQVQAARTELDARLAALDAIDGAIRVFSPEIAAEYLPVNNPVPVHAAATSEIRRFLIGLLRQREGRPVKTLEATQALYEAKGIDTRDKVLATLIRKRVSDAFGRMRKLGLVEGRKFGSGSELEWRLTGRGESDEPCGEWRNGSGNPQ